MLTSIWPDNPILGPSRGSHDDYEEDPWSDCDEEIDILAEGDRCLLRSEATTLADSIQCVRNVGHKLCCKGPHGETFLGETEVNAVRTVEDQRLIHEEAVDFCLEEPTLWAQTSS